MFFGFIGFNIEKINISSAISRVCKQSSISIGSDWWDPKTVSGLISLDIQTGLVSSHSHSYHKNGKYMSLPHILAVFLWNDEIGWFFSRGLELVDKHQKN